MPDSNKKYLDLITSEYYGKENYTKMVETLVGMLSPAVDSLADITKLFDLSNAVGDQLDKIGNNVNISRILPTSDPDIQSILDDDIYRTVIKAKIMMDSWNGTYESLISLVKAIFPQSVVQIQDNQDMTCYVNIFMNDITDEMFALLTNGYLFPNPSGVKITYTVYVGPLFGFDEPENENEWAGWGIGRWHTT